MDRKWWDIRDFGLAVTVQGSGFQMTEVSSVGAHYWENASTR